MAARWWERAAKGMGDDELAKALATENRHFRRQFLTRRHQPDLSDRRPENLDKLGNRETHEPPPTFHGGATMAMAREGYRIKDPADTQFALFWDLRERTGLALHQAVRRGAAFFLWDVCGEE